MQTDPYTLYKLMMLYMLKHVRFPLTHSQFSDFFLQNEYCTYYALEEAIRELLDSHLMKEEAIRNYIRYELTREGEVALEFFGKDIPEQIRRDMDSFLDSNRMRLKNEVGIISNYEETNDGEYLVSCEILERTATLMKIQVSVPSREQADVICERWKESNQLVYAQVMKELLRN